MALGIHSAVRGIRKVWNITYVEVGLFITNCEAAWSYTTLFSSTLELWLLDPNHPDREILMIF